MAYSLALSGAEQTMASRAGALSSLLSAVCEEGPLVWPSRTDAVNETPESVTLMTNISMGIRERPIG